MKQIEIILLNKGGKTGIKMFMKICSCGVLQLFERQMFSGNFSKGQDQILKMAVALFPEVIAQRSP